MIKEIRHHNIDFKKYEEFLSKSCQNADYAQKEFLNIVAGKNWSILVYNDNEAIMPIYWSTHFGIRFIMMPRLCQQLGVFSEKDVPEINQKFYDFLCQHFYVAFYAFNKDNQFDYTLKQKKSYFIGKNLYDEVRKKYSSHRRRNVRMTDKISDSVKISDKIDLDNWKNLFFENIKGGYAFKEKKMYWKLLIQLKEKNLLEVLALEFNHKKQSLGCFYKGKNKYYLGIFVNDHPLEYSGIPSILIDQFLQKHIEKKGFDFMGSSIKNVAEFNERFGSSCYHFSVIENSKKELLQQILSRLFKNRK